MLWEQRTFQTAAIFVDNAKRTSDLSEEITRSVATLISQLARENLRGKNAKFENKVPLKQQPAC